MKRLFTRCLLVMMLIVMGFTTAMAQKSVLDESFASGKPAGWTVGDWKFDDGNALFTSLYENAQDTLITPLLDLSDLNNKPSVSITYSNTANGDKVNTLIVYYRASENAPWSTWKTFAEATDGQVTVKDVLPDGLDYVQIKITGVYKLGAETRVYRLAVENKTEAAAAPTGLRTEDLTTNSVLLWWDACSSPLFVQYNLKINSSKMTDMSAEADIVDYVGWNLTDEWYELENLKPNKEYWFYVQYDCASRCNFYCTLSANARQAEMTHRKERYDGGFYFRYYARR